MSEQTQEPHLSTDEILRIGRDFQKSDNIWRGATFDTAKLLCDEIERLARRLSRLEDEHSTVMKILRDVELYPSSLDPHDDDFDRPSGDEMHASYRAVCQIRILYPGEEGRGAK